MLLRCYIPLGSFAVDIDVSFESRVTSIFGPSGAGKTSLLDAIAGLRAMSSGEIEIGGRLLYSSSREIDLSPQERSIGYVPQEGALFPHLSVRKNVLFGAKRKAGFNNASGISLEHVTAVLEIGNLLDQPVVHLSGGEWQRVALARAILSRPQLLLLDEPLASLDIGLKERIIPYLRRVRDEFAIPMIYVTHNPTEVLSLADWVIVIREGRLVTQGIPGEVLMSGRVLSYLDEEQVENVFNVHLLDSDPKAGRSRVRLDSGKELFIPYTGGTTNMSLQIRIRGDDILVAKKQPEEISAGNVLRGMIVGIETINGQSILRVDAGAIFCVRLTTSAVERLNLLEGQEIFLVIKTRSCLVL
ncbi:MAG: molybdenum ABC transporter ATP-binding protein [Candidatus Binatia bacterium]